MDVQLPVLQADAAGGGEMFEEFSIFGDFLEEAKGCAASRDVAKLGGAKI